MSNIIIFPSSNRPDLASQADIEEARDQLFALLASLDALNSELSLLLREENGQAASPASCKPESMRGGTSRGNSSVGTG